MEKQYIHELERMKNTMTEITIPISELDLDTLTNVAADLGELPVTVACEFLRVAMYAHITANYGDSISQLAGTPSDERKRGK